MSAPTTPRELADEYVTELAEMNPAVSTQLGLRPHDDRVPDLSPSGYDALAASARSVLERLDAIEARTPDLPDGERRCAVLLRERMRTQLETYEAGDHLREIRNIGAAPQSVRSLFTLMPTASDEDWACVARRMARVPQAYVGWVQTLDEGRRRGLLAAPRQALTLADLLQEWVTDRWWHGFVADGPDAQQPALAAAADAAHDATVDLERYLRQEYAPAAAGTTDAVGEERYRRGARRWLGADIDPHEAYAWGWEQYRELDAQMRELAEQILPGASPVEAMRHLDEHGTLVHGVDEVRATLQRMMDDAIADLDGTHFEIAAPLRHVEAMIAPAGSAAAPYYTRPSMDFARPGRTWLPTLGRTSFPMYDLVSTWYHEGVPGHHLQLAQWVHVAPQLTMFQTSVGSSSGATEGWALYAERLMDELGYLDAEGRMGYLDCQMMRAVRVVIDIGMHLGLTIPEDSPIAPGRTWTPELAEQFFAAHSGRSADFIASEIVRYLGWPGQAISYKLGERAWLAGREAARAAARERGEYFDLKAWHMRALSLGALGLDDLERELARL